MTNCYSKILTKNDAGETSTHQSGVAVPKGDRGLIDFLPALDLNQFNPSRWVVCRDGDGEEWKLRYIYYNGRTFDPKKSTRNEYRLTHTSGFMRKYAARAGDELLISQSEVSGEYLVEIRKRYNREAKEVGKISERTVVLTGWNKVF
jgi:hypothetical protein